MRLKNTKFYITGADGWLGTELIKRLLTDPNLGINPTNIYCLIEPNKDFNFLAKNEINFVVGDIRSRESTSKFLVDSEGGIVIHAAGIIHPRKISLFNEINFIGSQNILSSSVFSGVKKIIAISSNSPFGSNTKGTLFNENSPYNPYMGYGFSKKKMEEVFSGHRKNNINPRITMLRAPWFYGPSQPQRQSLFFSMIRRGKFPVFGGGNTLRSMTYVGNLVDAIILAIENPSAEGEDFWISDERPYSMIEVIKTIQDLMATEFGLSVNCYIPAMPNFLPDIARVIDGGVQKLGFYNSKIHVLSEMNLNIACDISKAQRLIGYRPSISLRDGMHNSIHWCLSNGIQI
jgi:nucleoside-diphosphate-sugar epimerase